MTTRIKLCGLTRPEDVDAAVAAGADAVGFVFYPASPRYVSVEHAALLIRRLPPFVLSVGLFVNAAPDTIAATLARLPLNLLQFHGDESPAECERWQRPYLKAVRVVPGVDLRRMAADFATARALLLDADTKSYGGSGKTFDWSLIPADLSLPIVLSGGLTPENVGAAILQVRPLGVDVSSGIEVAKGQKDHRRMRDFVAAVKAAEQAMT
ncbi:MAG: phosphoribosylanthranilate isomerase [Zoogloeaceae bacterium]|jgi:phosphoribosylanthranilate isomerase|nr:phosphoribosylanthranilate isomerase [Zoogloeaceae bacterium]